MISDMANRSSHRQSYPDELNPFDDDTGDTVAQTHKKSFSPTKQTIIKPYYPEQLNPFDSDGGAEEEGDKTKGDEYDDSFNPFSNDIIEPDATGTHSRLNNSSLSKTDYDNSLNPFDEDEEENVAQISRNNSSNLPLHLSQSQNQHNDGQQNLPKSSKSQPHLTVSNVVHSRRSSPNKRHRKRAAPKPPTEQSPVHCDEQTPSLVLSNIDDKPLQSITSQSDDNPSLSYSSIQSSSSSQIIPEAQQVQQPKSANNINVPSSCEDVDNGDNTLTVSSDQPDQLVSEPRGIFNKPSRVPSPAIRSSLNSINFINRSSSSLSSHRDSSSAYPSCRSHDGSMANVSDDFRPIPLPRTRSLLKKEARLAANISSSDSKNLKEKLENIETESGEKNSTDQIITNREISPAYGASLDPQNGTIDDIDHTSIQPLDVSNEVPTNQDVKLEDDTQECSLNNNNDTQIVASDVELGSTDENLSAVDLENSSDPAKEDGSNKSLDRSLHGEDSSDKNAALWRKLGLKKRAAPPLPVNFKRQVFGSLVEIEDELNEIGDSLVDIEKQSLACRMEMHEERLKAKDELDVNTANTQKFIELVKEKCNLARRQKELMYRKREHILDQSHSDIEYELRMIGNKQASHRTEQDDQQEQGLLKRLVEIIEEKNDIVENLIRDNSMSDEEELNEALKRLDIKLPAMKGFRDQQVISSEASFCDSSNVDKATSNGNASKQDKAKNKSKHRPSTAKAFKTLKKYGKVVVKMSKKEDSTDPSATKSTSK